MERLMSHEIATAFEEMNTQLREFEKKYNPEKANLHFASEAIPEVDETLFHELLKLSRRAIEIVKDDDQRYSNRTDYAYMMFDFWYEYFLLIGSAAIRVNESANANDIPRDLVVSIIEDLIYISGFSTIVSGDLYFRNREALGNTLLAFQSSDLAKHIKNYRKSIESESIKGFLDEITKRVNRILKSGKNAPDTARKLSPHWCDNWKQNSGAVLASRIYAE
jgi:hypothetical protein